MNKLVLSLVNSSNANGKGTISACSADLNIRSFSSAEGIFPIRFPSCGPSVKIPFDIPATNPFSFTYTLRPTS